MKKGRVWKYGDSINTDVIFPGKYTYSISEPEEMAAHALEDLDPQFSKKVKPGDVIVAGWNFGCGSSREQAAACLKYAGIQAVIAKSFARIFFRNAINQGLPVIQSQQAAEKLKDGEEVVIDFTQGQIRTEKDSFNFQPLPEYILKIVKAGGLIPFVRNKLKKEREVKKDG